MQGSFRKILLLLNLLRVMLIVQDAVLAHNLGSWNFIHVIWNILTFYSIFIALLSIPYFIKLFNLLALDKLNKLLFLNDFLLVQSFFRSIFLDHFLVVLSAYLTIYSLSLYEIRVCPRIKLVFEVDFSWTYDVRVNSLKPGLSFDIWQQLFSSFHP